MGDAAGNGIDALISLASGALLLTPQAIDDGIDSIRIALDPFNIICVGLELSGRPVFLFAKRTAIRSRILIAFRYWTQPVATENSVHAENARFTIPREIMVSTMNRFSSPFLL